MLYYKGTGHLKESGYQGASGPWGTEETRAQRTPKATSLQLCLCSIPLSLSETGSPYVLGSITSKRPQPATSKLTSLPSRRQAESAWTLLGPMLSSPGGSAWTSSRQVTALGQSERPEALESQLLAFWPDRPGRKRVVRYLGLQQKP